VDVMVSRAGITCHMLGVKMVVVSGLYGTEC
jgi:hypothetical protein